MDEIINSELFNKLAKTAGLLLTDHEADLLRKEMNRQMDVIRQLEAIPLHGELKPVVHGNPYPEKIRCNLRADEWKPYENAAGIVREAPKSRDGYVISPDIPHQKIG